MDKRDIAHITLWFISNYRLTDFMDEERFKRIYKREIGKSPKQLAYAEQVRMLAIKTLAKGIEQRPREEVIEVKPKEKEEIKKPKPKEEIRVIKVKPSEEEPQKIRIIKIREEKPKVKVVRVEERKKVEEKPVKREIYFKVKGKPSFAQRVVNLFKRIFRRK